MVVRSSLVPVLYLSQRGGQSKLQDGHPASVAPGKRPRLTPAPALVLRDGQPVMALGAHGGDHIPQGTLQIFLNVVEFGLDPQEAVESARFYSYNFPSSGFPSANRPGVVRTEGRISQEAVDGLQRRGHTVEAVSGLVGGLWPLRSHHAQSRYRSAPGRRRPQV